MITAAVCTRACCFFLLLTLWATRTLAFSRSTLFLALLRFVRLLLLVFLLFLVRVGVGVVVIPLPIP